MSDDVVTISSKISEQLRDRIDEIGKGMGISNRSVLVRKALEAFVEGHTSGGIPPLESKTEEDEGNRTLVDEMLGIPQGSAASSRAEEKDGNRRQDNGGY